MLLFVPRQQGEELLERQQQQNREGSVAPRPPPTAP